jgi:hypothetical protein
VTTALCAAVAIMLVMLAMPGPARRLTPSEVAPAPGAVSQLAAVDTAVGQADRPQPAENRHRAARAAAPANLSVTAFGDSVMLGAQSAIEAAMPRSTVRAVEGQQPYVTLAEVRKLHAQGALSTVVVIHTGNNGIIRPSDLAATLSVLRDRRRVVLLTDRVPRDWETPNNQTIERIGPQFANVVVLDWLARSNNDRSWFYSDGLHLRPVGAQHYAELVRSCAEQA